ncbi:thiamine phosphate synthase [Microvirga sp. W0021]|uniref:Thiamine-phosphate synthase n=1 Tax=Hohaiivirga grylli TaxID=3133970 RepID=A0ABV0BNP1_9HYPH
MTSVDIRLYGIIDPQIARGRPLHELVLAAVQGGATLIQYRDKTSDTRPMIEQARAIKNVLAGTSVPLLINDRIDVALASGAEGVHIGQSDMYAQDARHILGASAIIGLTVNNAINAEECSKLPVDYACIGSVFPTNSKDDAGASIGLDGFSKLARQIRSRQPFLPVGAISGINHKNAASVIEAGSDGIAIISALFSPDDITSAAQSLNEVITKAFQAQHNQ